VADVNVGYTAGSGTNFRGWQSAGTGTPVIQYTRDMPVDTPTRNSYTPSTTGTANQVASSADRVVMLMVNNSSVRVYLRFDGTVPTATVFDWYLEPNERWELSGLLARCAVSMLGAAAGATGTFNTFLGGVT
jgi:hypothetical protein